MKEYKISKNEAGQRLDKYLLKLLCNAEKNLIFKQLRNKNILLNHKKAKGNEFVNENDCIQIFMAETTLEKFTKIQPIHIVDDEYTLDIIYEDKNIILADKPVGVLSQKAELTDISMNEYLIKYLAEKGDYNPGKSTFKPSFCNRLDRNTSGLMIAGKSMSGLQTMSKILKDRSLQKYYLAIVIGEFTGSSSIKGYLYKDKRTNKVTISQEKKDDHVEIHTEYQTLQSENGLTLLKVHLITGKTHQIRAHLASVGNPILGDPKYGNKEINQKYLVKRQLLHSYEIIFPEMEEEFQILSNQTFQTNYPKDFKEYFNK